MAQKAKRNQQPRDNPQDGSGQDEAPNYPIGSVDNALRLLRLFGEHKTIRIADASREIGVARSTAHRMMQMLQYHGFARQDPRSRAYTAGDELVRIGLSVVRQLDLRSLTSPALHALVDELNETAHLVQLRGREAFFLDSVESQRQVRAGSRLGMSLPAYCSSTGKVLLAELTAAQLRKLFPQTKLEPITPKTVRSRSGLEKELATIREQGYATNFGESEDDVAAVAVPIRDSAGIAHAALAISAPLSRFDENSVVTAVKALEEQADRVGATLPS